MTARKIWIGGTAALWAVAAVAAGQEVREAPENLTAMDEEIVVTGTRIPLRLDEIGGSVSVITQEDLKLRQDVFALDALEATPGLSIAQNGSFGGVSSVFIRGLASDQTLVLIDGVRANDRAAAGGGFNAANLTTANIERIEILRGPQSLLHGSDAIGGVINVITRPPEPGLAGTAELEGGSFATVRSEASVSGGTKRAKGRLSLSGFDTEGISKADGDDGNTEEDGYTTMTAGARGDLTLLEDRGPLSSLTVNGGVRYTESDVEIDGFPPPNFTLVDSPEVSEDDELILDAGLTAHMLDGRLTHEVRGERYRLDRISRNTDTGALTFEAEGASTFVQYQATWEVVADQTIAFGAEREVQSIDTATEEDEITLTSGFALWSGRFLERISINLGVRHDDHETFGGETTFRGGATIDVPETGTLLRGSWGQGFKAPTPFQLNFVFAGIPANPDLQPEDATGWDVGVEQGLLGERLSFQATYFETEVEDLIEFVAFSPGFAVTYANISAVTTEGVETALEARPLDWLSLSGTYTYLEATNEETGADLARRPEHAASGRLTVVPPILPDLTLTALVTYNGEEPDGGTVLDAWTRLDLRAAYRLSQRFEVFGRIDNVTDADYQQVLGYGTPGLSAFGGIRARFG